MSRSAENFTRRLKRYLRDGTVILLNRGPGALWSEALREAAAILDSPTGIFLAPRDIRRQGIDMVRRHGLRVTIAAVLRHAAARHHRSGLIQNPVNNDQRANVLAYHYTDELTKPDGVVSARRPVNELDFALEIPFRVPSAASSDRTVAVIVHAFYLDGLDRLIALLDALPCRADIFFSTDTEAKANAIRATAADWTKGGVEVRVLPNRGRDIAAKIVGFADVYDRYEIFLALHTKKSPHGGDALARWRDHLFANLIGSRRIMDDILSLFHDERLGIVFAQHLFAIRGILNWGYDYDLARDLMRRMGQTIDKSTVLEFPSGSMFWGRSAALRPLLDLHLGWDDFPEENGWVDGTIAHAIERIFLMVAETAGYEWLKVATRDTYPLAETLLACAGPEDVVRHRPRVFRPCLCAIGEAGPTFAAWIRERRPIATYPCRSRRRRVNLLVPTINPRQIFGGVGTALALFEQWADTLGPDVDRRIIVTDAVVEPEAYASHADYVAQPFAPPIDPPRRAIVDASEREGGQLDVRSDDIFVATAWWTAEIARRIEVDRRRMFGGRLPFVYLIQDDETCFYGSGSKSELARGTYLDGADILAVVNSEELYDYMMASHSFAGALCLPYTIDPRIEANLRAAPREPTILVYARPSVARNAFEIACAGLHAWQRRDPIRASRWQIVMLGETFATSLIAPLQNVSVEGKLDLAGYADRLSRASVGLSLMTSPHPSYPPLEMARAGLATIVNDFEDKSLRNRIEDCIVIGRIDADHIAEGLERAVGERESAIGRTTSPRELSPPPGERPIATPAAVAAMILAGWKSTAEPSGTT